MMNKNKKTVRIGKIYIGGDNSIAIQSMTNTKTSDIAKTIEQVKELKCAGCDIIRVSVPDKESAFALKEIKKEIALPIVADIHYDYKLALLSCDNGADKIRINPGNIGSLDKVKYLADYLNERDIPIRIGVNSGSLSKEIMVKYGVGSKALFESAMEHIRLLEECNYDKIVVSVKSSNVLETIEAYKKLYYKTDYPLHIGVTESGIDESGIIKSSVGVGVLLYDGIGDTIRVSLTGNPVREVIVAKKILNSLGLCSMPELISCPTCARTMINVEELALEVEKRISKIKKPIKVAVMGCVVNGPGEAREADIGIAGGKTKSIIFQKGEIIDTVDNDKLLEELMKRIDKLVNG